MDFFDEVGDEGIQDAVESFVDPRFGWGSGVFAGDLIVKAVEERDVVADVVDFEDAGVEAVIEVGGEVGDFVGEVDELRFERRTEVEEVVGELGMRGGGVVA